MYGLPKRKQAASGGLIVGPGTGTSDSIEKTVPEGTYILPADTTEKLGFGLPGYNGNPKMPDKEQPRLGMPKKQVPVAVSNGEYEMPPQDVHALGAAVLDQLKNATHEQKGFGLTKAVMMAAKGQQDDGPRQFFANGGVVDNQERRGFGMPKPRSGRMQQDAPRLGMPGRKPVMQAESQGQASTMDSQPRLGMPRPTAEREQMPQPRLGIQKFASGGLVKDDSAGIGRMVGGALGVPVAAAREFANVAGTAAVNLGRRAIGGEPLPHPGYPRTAELARQTAEGASDFADANVNLFNNVRAGLRSATGVPEAGGGQAAAPTASSAARGNTLSPGDIGTAPGAGADAPAADPVPAAASPAGNGYTQAGNGIAMRNGADGVPEFTNDSTAVSGARTMPTGGMAGVGDGRGTFSVGQPGDAQLALDRFGRANDIRAQTIRESRQGQIGEGGGRVTVVRDSSRAPTRDDFLRARLEGMQAETDIRQQQAGLQAGQDARQAQGDQLTQQRLQQQIDEGNLSMQDRQRIDQLRAQINDPNLSEQQRAQALDAYNALSISPDARLKAQQDANTQQNRLIGDLYKSFSSLNTPPMIGEGDNARPMSFEEWLQPALRAIQGGGAQVPMASRQAPAIGTQQGGYEFIGGDPASPSSWRRV